MKSKQEASNNFQSQIEQIRKEKQLQFAKKQSEIKAIELLDRFKAILSELEQHTFPEKSNVDVYASKQISEQYITTLIELDGQLKKLLSSWGETEVEQESLVVSSMLSQANATPSIDLPRATKQFNHIISLAKLLENNIGQLLGSINNRDEERKLLDKSIISATNSLNRHLTEFLAVIYQQSKLNPSEEVEPETIKANLLDSLLEDGDEESESSFLELPEEIRLMIFNQVINQMDLNDLNALRSVSRYFKDLTDIAIDDMVKKPIQVVEYLSKADSITGHRFIAAYQHTKYYKDLKNKVDQDLPMTDEEIVCYTITRHSAQLPKGLEKAMRNPNLDAQTLSHLQLILEANKTKDQNKLLKMFLEHHHQRFVNLLPGVALYAAELTHIDLSDSSLLYAEFNHPYLKTDMSGIILRNTNISYGRLDSCNLNGADLRNGKFHNTNLNSADLSSALLDGADFKGADLTLAKFINVDLRKVDLSSMNLEWAYLKNVRLAPEAALESPVSLEKFLTQFEEMIASHRAGSKSNLREALLHDLAPLIDLDTSSTKKEKILLLKTILARYNDKTMPVSLIAFKNPCLELLQKIHLIKDNSNEINHPLKDAFLKHINNIKEYLASHPSSQVQRHGFNIDKYINEINELLKKDQSLTNGSKICQAFGIDEYLWHLICYMAKSPLVWPEQRPTFVDYPFEKNDYYTKKENPKKYASEVFNGELFDVNHLQSIKQFQLNDSLYQDEDFAIIGGDRSETIVKLGELLFTYAPGGKGSVYSTVQIIDFQNKQTKPCFTLNFQRRSDLPFEMFMPFDPFANYAATAVGRSITQNHFSDIEAGYALKKKIIEKIFATQHGPIPAEVLLQRSSLSDEEIEPSGDNELNDLNSLSQDELSVDPGKNDNASLKEKENVLKKEPNQTREKDFGNPATNPPSETIKVSQNPHRFTAKAVSKPAPIKIRDNSQSSSCVIS